ncbi:MAG: hypothetical protein IM613_17400 [Cytophagales bacterium]|nr:hypothetical protein [Cytophagales bacterium]MCA6387490.1 hypothetical protein [Cytophagales bacterium]MCA6393104.1 hypothetical protein [Cytophagales bacterium]MCA6397384.1 hypothetical protein [Cytophagales bacterium]MCA6403404.1 hypothetical protein [Cytophagales bacterium]
MCQALKSPANSDDTDDNVWFTQRTGRNLEISGLRKFLKCYADNSVPLDEFSFRRELDDFDRAVNVEFDWTSRANSSTWIRTRQQNLTDDLRQTVNKNVTIARTGMQQKA